MREGRGGMANEGEEVKGEEGENRKKEEEVLKRERGDEGEKE